MHKYLDLYYIKKKYGEKMANLCIYLFPTLLEKEGLLYNIMLSNFHPSRFLYDDIINNNLTQEFKKYIYSFIIIPYKVVNVNKTLQELFNEKGYSLFECKNKSDFNTYMKYYEPNEMLCSFKADRLEDHYVFFAIKKDVDLIKRNNEKPIREDKYGTSVLCIQFDKGDYNFVKIISRYNHTVKNPDATFENNLEKINVGITKRFEQEYYLNIPNSGVKFFKIPGYIKAKDGKYYKYSYKIDSTYYCMDNIIIDNGTVIKKYTDKSRYLFMDYFILDLQKKVVSIYKKNTPISKDSFVSCLKNIYQIIVLNENDYKIIKIVTNNNIIIIKTDKQNKITEYYNREIEYIPDNFMIMNNTLKTLELPNVKIIGNMCLFANNSLSKLFIPKDEELGEYFLYDNTILEELIVPKLKIIKTAVLKNNCNIKKVEANNLTIIDSKPFIDNNYKSITSMKLMSKLKLISLKNRMLNKLKIDQKTKKYNSKI